MLRQFLFEKEGKLELKKDVESLVGGDKEYFASYKLDNITSENIKKLKDKLSGTRD